MRKSDLKSGMRVVLRNGRKYIVVGETLYTSNWGYTGLGFYNNEFKYTDAFLNKNIDYDIMKIYNPQNIDHPLDDDNFTEIALLWERKELSEQDKKVIDAIKVLHPNSKWIARDEDSCLCTYTEKPKKAEWDTYWIGNFGIRIDSNHLQFIQWSDDEPYCIGE